MMIAWRAFSRVAVLTLATLVFGSPLGSDNQPGYAAPSAVEIFLDSWTPYYQPHVAVLGPHTAIQWFNPTASPHTIRHVDMMAVRRKDPAPSTQEPSHQAETIHSPRFLLDATPTTASFIR